MKHIIRKIINKPYYYIFIVLFSITVFYFISYFIVKRIESGYQKKSEFDKRILTISDTFGIKPFYNIDDIWSVIKFNLFTRGIDVRNLALEYQRLKSDYAELKAENEKLADLIKYSPSYGKVIATGRILSDPNSFGGGVFTISVGESSGVHYRDIVTSDRGIVGKIVKVFDHTAVVLPIRHLSSKIVGRVQENDAMVLISGRHLQGGVIDYISDNVGLESGQQIISVADGISTPSGVPIGTIIDKLDKPIQIRFNVDFSRLDYVTVIRGKIEKQKKIYKTDISSGDQLKQSSDMKEQENSVKSVFHRYKTMNQVQDTNNATPIPTQTQTQNH